MAQKKQTPDPKTKPVNEAVRLSSLVASEAAGGLADSVAQSFKAFSGELEKDADECVANRVLDGVIAGQANFFEGLANMARKVADALKEKNGV